MKSISINILVFLATIAFYFLFWGEKMGLNTLLFSSLILSILAYLHPDRLRDRNVQILAGGAILTAILVVFHNSSLAKVMHIFSMILLSSIVQVRELRFLIFGFILAIIRFFETPVRFFKNIGTNSNFFNNGLPFELIFRYLKIAILPMFLVFIFGNIYMSANLKFAEIMQSVGDIFAQLFTFNISFERFFFILFSFLTSGMLLYKSGFILFEKIDKSMPDQLIRTRKSPQKRLFPLNNMLSLKNEYRSAVLLFITLNLLLFIANSTDLRHIWAQPTFTKPHELSIFVHEGTYLLIISILLAAVVLVWFFRGNLNFYQDNHLLRRLATIWVAQNALLALSVGMRNWHYVNHFGLAHKRVGVFLFLLMVLCGLYFLYQKVHKKHSITYLFRKNAWVIWGVLLLASFVNWDTAITRYNLTTETKFGTLDYHYLFHQIGVYNIPVLEKHQTTLKEKVTHISEGKWSEMINDKFHKFQQQNKSTSWLSWNYKDQQVWDLIEKEGE